MHVESDQIHIVAMANAFGISIKVANLDASICEGINYHEITSMFGLVDDAFVVSLLYRPGHYDILYLK